MNHMSVFLKNKVLTGNLRTTPVYVALFAGESEVVGASYARQLVTFTAPVDGQTTNDIDVLFPIAAEVWGAITQIAVYDALTVGNQLFKSPAEFVKTIDVSSQYKVPKNYLIIRLK